ncbi:MAG TPA: hypothetical protein PJ986_14100 [Gammaproteobacteria bacterium]|nr:hypothetical protein [Gammaproteobacteria bacterium]
MNVTEAAAGVVAPTAGASAAGDMGKLVRASSVDPKAGGKLTVFTNASGLLTKSYDLDADGSLQKATRGQMSRGTARRVSVRGVCELAALMQGLETNQALAHGIFDADEVRIVPDEDVHRVRGAKSRTKKFMRWPTGPAIMMIDHDPAPDAEPITPDDLRRILIEVCPALAAAPMVSIASSSSFIYNAATGEQLQGLRGFRLYVLVAKGTDIPRAGKALFERLWLAGRGRFAVSKSGQHLKRSLIDATVWSPEHLDFAAGAACTPPLEQRRPTPTCWNDDAPPFDTRGILDLTPAETSELEAIERQAKDAVADEVAHARAEYVKERGEALKARGVDSDRAHAIVSSALDRGVLYPEFSITLHDGIEATVAEILDNPKKYNAVRCADPLEPDYRNDRRVAIIRTLGGRPSIYSHAHGDQTFELCRQPTELRVQPGEESWRADDALQVMRRNHFYDYGPRVARVTVDGTLQVLSSTALCDHASRVVRWTKYDARSKAWAPTAMPPRIADFIVERTGGERGLPPLTAVITAPTMRPDGTVLDVPGYDDETGLYYATQEVDLPRVPDAPSIDDVRAALRALWAPVALFPYDSAESRAVMLAALLTAAVRPGVPTVPGFAFDAPAAGSGKTLAARTVAALMGRSVRLLSPPRDEAELGKVLFAALLAGDPAIVFDNVVRPVEGAALNAFLTAPTYADRVLGESRVVALPNRSLLMATGNNIRFVGDTCRRFLACRIDARVEVPFLRRFGFDPVTRVQDNRIDLIIAALTVLRGYMVRGVPLAAGRLASFEVWDDLVRQCVCWLAEIDVGLELADPITSAVAAVNEDPQKAVLAAVLAAWRAAFADRAVPAKDAIATADGLGEVGEALDAAMRDVHAGDVRFDAKRLGLWLRQHAGQIAGGLRFERAEDRHTKAALWRAVPA